MAFHVKFYYPNRPETKGFTVYSTLEQAVLAPDKCFYSKTNLESNPIFISIEDTVSKEVWYIPIFKG